VACKLRVAAAEDRVHERERLRDRVERVAGAVAQLRADEAAQQRVRLRLACLEH
jgi:hypothetical protein